MTTGTEETGTGIETAKNVVELGTFDPDDYTPAPGSAEAVTTGSADRISAFVADGSAMKRMANSIAQSGAYKHKNPNVVLTIMLQAYELNIGIGTALKGMYPVSGKLELETWLMAGLAVMRSGVRWDDVEVTSERCVLRLHRDGWEPKESEYTLEHAEKMGLIRELKGEPGEKTFKTGRLTDPWFRSTEEMLYWRALSKGLKRIAPDYFGGMYVRGELSTVPSTADPRASADLDALIKGVEPDEAEFTLDEIDGFSREVTTARNEGVISRQKAKAMLDAVVAGKWKKCRDDQSAMREKMLEKAAAEVANGNGSAKEPDENGQGSLL